MAGKERHYDFQEIHRNRERRVPWKDLAASYGRPESTIRCQYYRWLKTKEGEKSPDYTQPAPAFVDAVPLVLTSRPDNTFVLGVAGDRHHGSKYHRNDVLSDLYRRFDEAGVDCVFDTGNWIDGDSRFNRHDLIRVGLTPQLQLMAEQTPPIGAPTFAVWGDDHEGWYAQREGIDVGEYAEGFMQRAGHDWHNLGYMEAHVILRNANTGAQSVMAVQHPGGGTAYALSYRPQKIVESLEGGEKPAVILMGHYHKLEALNIRNVWVLQTGTCMDQNPFMRKKSIEAHVGGVVLGLEQDPSSGAIVGFSPQMIRYFNRGFYLAAQRWNKAGSVSPVERTVIPPAEDAAK